MKSVFSLAILAVLSTVLCLSQVGCAGVYAVGPGPAYYAPSPVVPVVAWGGAGFYGGTYYSSRTAYYNSSYYRSASYRNSYYRSGSRGYSYRTPWSNGGSYTTRRGGSASWHNGSGSATGWRGGSASWGGGSGSWHGSRGRSGSWHR